MTRVLAPDAAGMAEAAALLRAGRLVAFATETVYGLGADATDAAAVASLYAAKRRPRFNPLICHYADAAAAFADVEASAGARALAAAFWPGPLTLVLPRRAASRVAGLVSAGQDSLAVRVPAHPVARALLRAVGRPVAAPSANLSGRVSPTSAEHVLDLGERIAAVVDGGPCAVGVESTVVDLTGADPVLLRPGGVTAEAIAAVAGPLRGAAAAAGEAPRASPGLLASHYAPRLPVRCDAVAAGPRSGLLAFGPPLTGAGAVYQLSAAADLAEAASRLFDGLRALDRAGAGLEEIAAMPIPTGGLGLAINDRLRRAAAPRG